MTAPDPLAKVQALADRARSRREARQAQRRLLWKRLQTEQPALAADLQALKQRFGQPAATRISLHGQVIWPPEG